MNEIAVTAVGADRPGIVAALTEALLDLGGNLADVRAALLRGSFAVALLVHVPDDVTSADVDAALRPVADRLGLGLYTGPAAPDHAHSGLLEHVIVSVYGADHPGIVHAVTGGLADAGANIVDLSSSVSHASAIYQLAIEVELPPGVSGDDLEGLLRPIAVANDVDLSIIPVTDELL